MSCFFRKGKQGYVAILMCVAVPVLMLGVKYGLDFLNYHRAKTYGGSSSSVGTSKKCAQKAALEVAKRWNPGLTLNQQKESLLRIADGIFNATTSCSIQGSGPAHDAIPGLEVRAAKAYKGKTFDPLRLVWGSAESTGSSGLDDASSVVQYTTVDGRILRKIYTYGGNQAFYRIMYGVEKNPLFLLRQNDDGDWISEDMFWDAFPCNRYWRYRATMFTFRGEYENSGLYGTTQSNLNTSGNLSYTKRVDPNDDQVQISVEDDKIRVQTDSDVGYAIPAQCNVDIVLAIPANGAACNENNRDNSSVEAERPTYFDVLDIWSTIDSSTLSQKSAVISIRATPIYQVAQAFKTFLRNNFEFTRGVNVGLIPYSGKLSIPPDRKVAWTENIPPFIAENFSANQNTCLPFIRGAFLYGTRGERDHPLVTTYIDDAMAAYDPRTDYWPIPAGGGSVSNTPYWGVCSEQIDLRHGGSSPLTGVMCRGVTKTSPQYGGNSICIGDLMSTENPATTTKWRRMNNNPCYLGHANFLSMTCDKNCTVVHNEHESFYQALPYFLVELQADVGKVCDLLNVMGPFVDDYNVSNFIFIPLTWANNLFQAWTNDPVCSAVNTVGSGDSVTTGGRLSRPTKLASGRKKAVIIIINKPDWFEPGELTYLGFDNDYSEIPMTESDTISFDVDYSDESKVFVDGTGYDGTIAGPKKILKFETVSGNIGRNTTSGFYETLTHDQTCTAKLSFPNKYLVKIVVEPKAQEMRMTEIPKGPSSLQNINCAGWWYGITNIGGKLIALSSHGEVATSSDRGASWTRVDDGSLGDNWSHITNAEGTLVALNGSSGGGKVATSSDEGASWKVVNDNTLRSINDGYWRSITNVGGTLVALNGEGEVATSSSDVGKTWARADDDTLRGISNDETWHDITNVGGTLVALSHHGYVATSSDVGKTWTRVDDGSLINFWNSLNHWYSIWRSIIDMGGTLVALNHHGDVATSSDVGKTWAIVNDDTLRNIKNEHWLDMTNVEDVLIVLHMDGSIAIISLGTATRSIQFTNITSSSGQVTSSPYEITEKTEFYIEPSQISDDNTITFNMKNIRLISAEITNRPYECVTSSCTLSGGSSDTATIIADEEQDIVVDVCPLAHTCSLENDSSLTNGYTKVITNLKLPVIAKAKFVPPESKYEFDDIDMSFLDKALQGVGGRDKMPGNGGTTVELSESISNKTLKVDSVNTQLEFYAQNLHMFFQTTLSIGTIEAPLHFSCDYGSVLSQSSLNIGLLAQNLDIVSFCPELQGYVLSRSNLNIHTIEDAKLTITDDAWSVACCKINIGTMKHDSYVQICSKVGLADSTLNIHTMESGSSLKIEGIREGLSDSKINIAVMQPGARVTINSLHGAALYKTSSLNIQKIEPGAIVELNKGDECGYLIRDSHVRLGTDDHSALIMNSNNIDSGSSLTFVSPTGTSVTSGTIGHVVTETQSEKTLTTIEGGNEVDYAISPETHCYMSYSDYQVYLWPDNVQITSVRPLHPFYGTVTHVNPSRKPVGVTYTSNQTITISPSTHEYEKQDDGKYKITLQLLNAKIENARMVNAGTTIRYKKLPLPDTNTTRVVDFSQKVSLLNSEIKYPEDTYFSCNMSNFVWDSNLGYWKAPNEIDCRFVYKGLRENMFVLIEDLGPSSTLYITDSDGQDVYGFAGLHRRFFGPQDLFNAVSLMNCSDYLEEPCKYYYAGITRPVNAMLYYGASGSNEHDYAWQSNTNGEVCCDATTALCGATLIANRKFYQNYDDARVYFVKYRKQTRCNRNAMEEVDFDYAFIDDCLDGMGEGNVYDVDENFYKKGGEDADTTTATAEANLARALNDIAEEIKSWAGYEGAKNVN
ncbi:MAG: glycoside hydrolase [Holosporaceae bacterium]|jgi:hypothetical protein|nr:glycoside hydrolase [Holosporaceae bacterium]